MKALFIGGTNDGNWIDCPIELKHIELLIKPYERRYQKTLQCIKPPSVETEFFRKIIIQSGGTEFFFYALEQKSDREAIDMLIRGYKKQESETP
jgi:hypothetical protein